MKTVLTSEMIKRRTLMYEPIDENYCQYIDIIKTCIDGKVQETRENRGLATIDEIVKIKNFEYITGEVSVDWMYENKGIIIGVTKENYDKLLKGELSISNIQDNSWENSDDYNPNKYVYCIHNLSSTYQLSDLNKKIIRYPIFLDYIVGGITDANYDLIKVLEFMKTDHRFLPAKYNKDTELHIMSIPYYNADDEFGYNAIEFCYIPDSDEEMLKLECGLSWNRIEIIRNIFKPFKIK